MRRGRDEPGQSGQSLIEVLLVVVLSVVLILPLSAWVIMAMRQQPETRDGITETASAGLLGSYLPRDAVAAAAAAVDGSNDEVNFEDCRFGSGDSATPLLVMVVAGTPSRKIVYTEAPAEDGGAEDPSRRSVWRRECDAATGNGTAATQVVEDVAPGSTTSDCPSGTADAPCRQISFRTQPRSGGDPIVLRATRRVDSASLRFDRTGNRLPVAKIAVVSQTVRTPYTVELSSNASVDPDGRIHIYEWVIPSVPDGEVDPSPDIRTIDLTPAPGDPPPAPDAGPDQTVVWARAGTYFVQLTVTDDKGASTTTYKRIVIEPPLPIAQMRLTPETGVAGSTVVEFAAQWTDPLTGELIGSELPGGGDARYEWRIYLDDGSGTSPPDTSFITLRDDPAPWSMALPPWMAGDVAVILTVIDDEGLQSSSVGALTLDPTPLPAPAEPEDPVATFLAAPAGGLTWNLDASPSSPGSLGSPIVSWDWDLGPGLTPGTGAVLPVSFPATGSYPVTLTVTDDQGRTGTSTQVVDLPGPPPAPVVAAQVGPRLEWPAVLGAARYEIDVEYVGDGCTRSVDDVLVEPAEAPSWALLPNLCGLGATPPTARAKVDVVANGVVTAGTWVDLALPLSAAPPPTGGGG